MNRVKTPHMGKNAYGRADEVAGVFAASCASHAATALFISRVGRPDICVATQRLCSAVPKRKTSCDRGLARLMGYARREQNKVLHGELAPGDLNGVVINIYADADWNGDGETSKSTTGFWFELYSPSSGRSWPSLGDQYYKLRLRLRLRNLRLLLRPMRCAVNLFQFRSCWRRLLGGTSTLPIPLSTHKQLPPSRTVIRRSRDISLFGTAMRHRTLTREQHGSGITNEDPALSDFGNGGRLVYEVVGHYEVWDRR